MTPNPNSLVLQFMPRASSIARSLHARLYKHYSFDELQSIAYLALVQASRRWEDYCDAHDYDPQRMDYFAVYMKHRVEGAILDQARLDDPASRPERKAYKHNPDMPVHPTHQTAIPLDQPLSFYNGSSVYLDVPTSASTDPHEMAWWSVISNAALIAFRALPFRHSISLAYTQTKPPNKPVPANDQLVWRFATEGRERIVYAALSQLVPPTQLRQPLRLTQSKADLSEFLDQLPQPPIVVIEEFESLLVAAPDTLVNLIRRSKKPWITPTPPLLPPKLNE